MDNKLTLSESLELIKEINCNNLDPVTSLLSKTDAKMLYEIKQRLTKKIINSTDSIYSLGSLVFPPEEK